MANLTPTAGKDGVYQIETVDIVQGGAGGIANDPHQNLINRSELIFDALDGTISNANVAIMGDIIIMGDTGATTEEAFKVDTTTDGARLTYISQQLKIWSDTGSEGGQLTLTDKTGLVDKWKIDVGSTDNFRIFDETPYIMMEIDATEIVFNQSGIDMNFRVEGNADTNLIFCDADDDNVGIGTGTPATGSKLNVTSSSNYSIYVTNTAVGAGTKYGIWAASDTDSGVAVSGQSSGDTSHGGFFSHSGSGAGFGAYGTTSSTSTSAAGVKGSGDGAASYDFIAVNSRVSGFSASHLKVAKRDINILQTIRDYGEWSIQRWLYNYNEGTEDLILPYSDQFNGAFDLDEENNIMINTCNLSGVAFGGVVQLVHLYDELEKRIVHLEKGE